MRIYLDNNATTAIDPKVRARIDEVLASGPINPGSTHAPGRAARGLLEDAQASVLESLALKDYRVIFCGSATEAINLAMRGVCAEVEKPVIVHSSVEHPAIANTAVALGQTRRVGFSRQGIFDLDSLPTALQGATLAAFMYANNETGVLLPMGEIVAACGEAGVPLLMDCAQAPGKTPFSLAELRPQTLALAGHKFHAPVGIAALVVRDDLKLPSQLTGGGQAWGMRAGTEPVVLADALALALKLATEETDFSCMMGQRERLWSAIKTVAPGAALTVPDQGLCLVNTLHYRIPGLVAERQVIALDLAGVECSSASACSSGAAEPSKALLGMGYGRDEALEGVRISLSRLTTDAEVDAACGIIGEVLKRLLRQS